MNPDLMFEKVYNYLYKNARSGSSDRYAQATAIVVAQMRLTCLKAESLNESLADSGYIKAAADEATTALRELSRELEQRINRSILPFRMASSVHPTRDRKLSIHMSNMIGPREDFKITIC